MRKKLKKLDGVRATFHGTFARTGLKSGYRGGPKPTILLKNVTNVETGEVVSDHLWFNKTKRFSEIFPLEAGDIVQFDARVSTYVKGYRGYREEARWENPPRKDYKLSYPTKVRKVPEQEEQAGTE